MKQLDRLSSSLALAGCREIAEATTNSGFALLSLIFDAILLYIRVAK